MLSHTEAFALRQGSEGGLEFWSSPSLARINR